MGGTRLDRTGSKNSPAGRQERVKAKILSPINCHSLVPRHGIPSYHEPPLFCQNEYIVLMIGVVGLSSGGWLHPLVCEAITMFFNFIAGRTNSFSKLLSTDHSSSAGIGLVKRRVGSACNLILVSQSIRFQFRRGDCCEGQSRTAKK